MRLRSKLSLLFLTTILIPVSVIIVAVPTFYHHSMKKQMTDIAMGTLAVAAQNIEMYLDDLERLTITPYFHPDVMEALKLKASDRYKDLEPYQKMLNEKSLTFTLPYQTKNVRRDIMGTVLLPFDGSVYIVTPEGILDPVKDYPYAKQPWYKKAVEADGKVAFVGTHSQDYFPLSTGKEAFSVARLIKDPDSGKPLAVMMADADTIVLERIIREIRFNVRSKVVILDENRKLVYANRPISSETLDQLTASGGTVNGDNDTYAVVAETLDRSNWIIAVLLSTDDIKSQVRWIYAACYTFALGGIIVVLLLYFTLSRWMISPFKRMIQLMKKVQKGDLHGRLSVRGKDEVAQLGQALNTMVERLSELIDREYIAVLNKRDAEYRALQSQIQPHFLYNTLNGFVALNRLGQADRLEQAIFSLSDMLRYTLGHSEWTTVREEFDFLARYCELQRIRFEERLQVTINAQKEAENIAIPKLLLQPLVENAIIHGIEPKDGPGCLEVSARLEEHAGGRRLRVRIADDGVGFSDTGRPGGNVGLTNVRERLKLAYENASFTIDSVPGSGTLVTIDIPIKDVKA
ncbi:cache domain-containing sensor histidine kinase [Paenibacillus alkalitolerans]|uniref:cache domain-containing sensor histidine kinase n=1 Tax=Paenibacillus alkalitolerans TaxID=2799335 RepID=UPI0018F61C19|nr:sensor histidine kinase [Paenibacillus alkalitolerans]